MLLGASDNPHEVRCLSQPAGRLSGCQRIKEWVGRAPQCNVGGVCRCVEGIHGYVGCVCGSGGGRGWHSSAGLESGEANRQRMGLLVGCCVPHEGSSSTFLAPSTQSPQTMKLLMVDDIH